MFVCETCGDELTPPIRMQEHAKSNEPYLFIDDDTGREVLYCSNHGPRELVKTSPH